jgi:hypothetical protein
LLKTEYICIPTLRHVSELSYLLYLLGHVTICTSHLRARTGTHMMFIIHYIHAVSITRFASESPLPMITWTINLIEISSIGKDSTTPEVMLGKRHVIGWHSGLGSSASFACVLVGCIRLVKPFQASFLPPGIELVGSRTSLCSLTLTTFSINNAKGKNYKIMQ